MLQQCSRTDIEQNMFDDIFYVYILFDDIWSIFFPSPHRKTVGDGPSRALFSPFIRQFSLPCITASPTTDCFFPSQEDGRGRSPQGQHQHQPDRLWGSELLCLPCWWGPRDPRRGRQRLCWKGRQQIESYCSCNQQITTFIYCFYCKHFFRMSIVNSNFFYIWSL